MASEGKKKDDSREPVTVSVALDEAMATFEPGVEEGAVLRFSIPVTPRKEGDTDHLTFAAVWVGGLWYLTGTGDTLMNRYEHFDLMRALVKRKAFDIGIATQFEKVR